LLAVFLLQRYGPRPIDLDIIAYGDRVLELPHLQVPHPRARERHFVLAPVNDLDTCDAESTGPASRLAAWWRSSGGEALVGNKDLCRVLPLAHQRVLTFGITTHIVGVLNVTPDSFSDGGDVSGVASAVDAALAMAAAGASVIDIGGQSTRPGAAPVSASEELSRVLPVIQQLHKALPAEVAMSVDTFYGEVATAAVAAGAHIVNDVSGGRWDPTLLPAVAASGAAYVAMHSRGAPITVHAAEHSVYPAGGLILQVRDELQDVCRRAEAAGVHAWRILIDPGIGFAKTREGNLQLLRELASIRPCLPHAPIFVGASRKGFLGALAGGKPPKERDWATSATVTASIAGGAAFVRVHNVPAMRDVVAVADAIYRHV
jgi:2-amino-4-hydroxy-6-hydroxymethyldihydropteridine diphosphokinase/dihydropteroate synthase